ncbi:Protein-lysine N-methyltransferase efm6 [Cladophialophora chaetospira]|uniref:Protein-lysine N-methyltransferase EFM6 n=1 Tax=Cladophialophora chaetospira TaxID=386627 RepID=A0AA38X6U4_9EURO|nr:Protein-lysine N-methyltransferase efm6 [Cladophialophora chaetospira]
MPASRSPSPENDVFTISTTLIPERDNKKPTTTTITFDDLLAADRPLLLHEDLQEGCGGQLWPAGMVLSKYILQYHGDGNLKEKSIVEIGAGGGLVGLAVALGCEIGDGQKIHITDQIPMLALMKRNIALNKLEKRVVATVYDWGSAPPPAILPGDSDHPDVVLAADCVYFEPAFPLLLKTLSDLIGPSTTCYFCFKKRRKADMRFIRDMMKKFHVEMVDYGTKEEDQRQNIFLYAVTSKNKFK